MMYSYFDSNSIGKWVCGVMGSLASIFDSVGIIIVVSLEFVAIDFVIGVWASRTKAKCAGKLEAWGFESDKAWRTIYKAVFLVVGIAMCHQLDVQIIPMHDLHLANYFAGFCAGTELWSVLENAACISDHPLFRYLKRYMGEKIKGGGIDPHMIDCAAKREPLNEDKKEA